MRIKLLVGLSNPGDTYQRTRHNAGAWLVDALAYREHLVFASEKKFHAQLTAWQSASSSCLVLRPTTFMNHSGNAVRAVSQFYRILPEEILIAHDELDLAPGRIKLKTGGGHAGHNGLRDVMNQLGSPDFHRLRIGIGHPGHKTLVTDYVLGTPSVSDRQTIMTGIAGILPYMSEIFSGQFEPVMNRLARDKDEHGI